MMNRSCIFKCKRYYSSFIHRTHTIGDHFKYKDKQAHLERCNVWYTNLNVLVVIPILVKHKGIWIFDWKNTTL